MKREVDGFLFFLLLLLLHMRRRLVRREIKKEIVEGFHSSVDHDWMAAAAAGRYVIQLADYPV